MQGSTLYIANLKYTITNQQLKELFSTYGEVKSVKVMEDRGFGFVQMSSPEEAEEAMEALDNNEFEGRPLKISEARPFVKR